MSKGLHKGHRQRMKEKYLRDNFDNMYPHEALELLLYYAIPQRDTNPLAHQLIKHFGSISAVFDASIASLKDFGLTENVAILIKSIPDMARLYSDDKANARSIEVPPDKLIDFFKPKFIGRTEEVLYALYLDGNFNQLRCELLSKGSFTSTDVPVRRIVEVALMCNAKVVAIAHNHPLGMSIPSRADLDATKVIHKTLDGVGVCLIDHVVIADADEHSIANSTLGKGIFYD